MQTNRKRGNLIHGKPPINFGKCRNTVFILESAGILILESAGIVYGN
jgi:hypothetical protein